LTVRPVAAVVLGVAAGGIVAGGLKVFLLNTGPAAVGRTDWFVIIWLAAGLTGLLAAASGSPPRGLVVGLAVALGSGVLLEASPVRIAPVDKPLAHLVNAGACLTSGLVGGMLGQAVLRPPGRKRPPAPTPDDDPGGVE
jgi:hypothetical protein